MVRAYNPSPGAYFEYQGERVKCWQAEAIDSAAAEPGELVAAGRSGIDFACGAGALRMLQLQRPGRKKITAGEFAQQLTAADTR